MRGTEFESVRDNVLFELGLFIGRLGKDRSFIFWPEKHSDLHLPSDLTGITTATYDPERTNLRAALGPACNQVRRSIEKLGRIQEKGKSPEISCEAIEAAKRRIRTGLNDPRFRYRTINQLAKDAGLRLDIATGFLLEMDDVFFGQNRKREPIVRLINR